VEWADGNAKPPVGVGYGLTSDIQEMLAPGIELVPDRQAFGKKMRRGNLG
jgi:hypothetical protein